MCCVALYAKIYGTYWLYFYLATSIAGVVKVVEGVSLHETCSTESKYSRTAALLGIND